MSLALKIHKLSGEDQCCVGRDKTSGASRTVRHAGGDGECALLVQAHSNETVIPALDDLADAQCQRKGLSTVKTRVELLPIFIQGTGVVNLDRVALLSGHSTNFRFVRGVNLELGDLGAVSGSDSPRKD